jgi:hypothetical protein
MGEMVFAFLRCEAVDDVPDALLEVSAGTFDRVAQDGLTL